jgi:hypothetical protein
LADKILDSTILFSKFIYISTWNILMNSGVRVGRVTLQVVLALSPANYRMLAVGIVGKGGGAGGSIFIANV